MTAQLCELTTEILAVDGGTFSKLSDTAFNMVMLGIFMGLKVLTVYPNLFAGAHFLIYPWWVLIWGILLKDELNRCFKIMPMQQQIVKIVEQLLRYVLWHISVATLMEVGPYRVSELLGDHVQQLE
eukprot:CAMPEP_0180717976 /NCGR_PEP_ID=MMETSP1038_2-20121128/14253_1 /TAXON_ID=632150 /ORGANISM="Azadinium spinosum, Strain 3D9" /LENGTH=125 /DNA_ID=CAMNT_0022750465 /DNA_START=346 /DNA_END=720 /DNA_ORIENTATION=-